MSKSAVSGRKQGGAIPALYDKEAVNMRNRILVLALILLCGCGSKEAETSNKDDGISLQVPDTTEQTKEIPQVTVTEYPLPEEVAALEKLELKDMELYADEEQSMYNSNPVS
ncbi:MAG: hypothetical protein K2G16_09820 [Lachnospiraceae bacterium]|nr:hypothetical protein [Lachnospiraceae bacterium]